MMICQENGITIEVIPYDLLNDEGVCKQNYQTLKGNDHYSNRNRIVIGEDTFRYIHLLWPHREEAKVYIDSTFYDKLGEANRIKFALMTTEEAVEHANVSAVIHILTPQEIIDASTCIEQGVLGGFMLHHNIVRLPHEDFVALKKWQKAVMQ